MKLILLIITLSCLASCVPESTIITPPIGDPGTLPPVLPTPDPEDPGDYGKVPYYSFQSLIAHGGSSSTVIWSSATSTAPHIDDQNIFRTDVMLKLRIIAKSSPGKGTDSTGVSCDYYAMNYSALKLKVGVRAQTSSTYSDIRDFADLRVGVTSETVTFRPPVTTGSFVVDVLAPQWDWYAINYPNSGYPDWVPVFDPDCIEFELQMVTDSTFDF